MYGGNGTVSGAVQNLEQISGGMQTHRPLAVFSPPQDIDAEFVVDHNTLAGAHLLARPNQRRPSEAIVGHRLGEKYFPLSSRAFFPLPLKTRREYA